MKVLTIVSLVLTALGGIIGGVDKSLQAMKLMKDESEQNENEKEGS